MGSNLVDRVAERHTADTAFTRGFWNGTAWALTGVAVVFFVLGAATGKHTSFWVLASLSGATGMFIGTTQRRAHGTAALTRTRRQAPSGPAANHAAMLGCMKWLLAVPWRPGPRDQAWVDVYCADLADAANRWATHCGYPAAVTADAVAELDRLDAGYADYHHKLCLHVAKLVVYGAPR